MHLFTKLVSSYLFYVVVFLFSNSSIFAQKGLSTRKIPSSFRESTISIHTPLPNQQIWATQFKLFTLDYYVLNTSLDGDDIPQRLNVNTASQVTIQLPNPQGTFDEFRVLKNSTMHPELMAKYPESRTYDVVGIKDRSLKGKIDITPQGFHAMIFDRVNGTYFIDPVEQNRTDLYLVYYKKDFVTEKSMTCSHEHEEENSMLNEIINSEDDMRISYASCALRTYRLAVAATGEYTTFHGGTVALALAAQVTSMNRVNGVYEREIAITMQLIPNNDLIIYTNASNDPYTNGTPGTMITQNQTNITNVIGSANYDIGHVFGTNSGGLAGLGVVCSNSNKARGVTGSSAPVGDPFDIDYVAHEIGHQFGANHTQNNNCNSVANSRFEPGSASTIMGYAGICAPNVQNNSDDYFHSRSLQEMGTFISGSSHTCPVLTNIANQSPSIVSTNGAVAVPANTPFALTATATDPNSNNTLVYRWEQYNNQASTQPPLATATGGPNFRSFVSSTSPTRYFPSLAALASNGPFTWEVVPSISRTMNFRVTVHDDHQIGGCSDYLATTLNFDATAGPFILTYPSATGISWEVGSPQTITWDVANTNNAAINCQLIKIFMSTNGGASYPILIAEDVPNTGSFELVTPDLPNTTSRIMIMADNGTFFDVSNNNFSIVAPQNTFELVLNLSEVQICPNDDAIFEMALNQVGNFSGDVDLSVSGLPLGTSITWTNNPVNVPGQTTLSIQTDNLSGGVYNFEIVASSASGNQSMNATLTISTAPLDASFNLVGQELVANQSQGQYQWYDCKNTPPTAIVGAIESVLVLTETTGSYALEISNENCSNLSECIEIDMTFLNSFEDGSISMYPNPAHNELAITWDSQLQVEQLKLYDASGKRIFEVYTHGASHVFDLSELSQGMYFIELLGANQNYVSKVIKN